MKNKILLFLSVLVVMVLSVVSVYGITGQGGEVEKAYASSALNNLTYGTSVPSGFSLLGEDPIPAGTPLFIDTSVSVPFNYSPVATASDVNQVSLIPLTTGSFSYAINNTFVSLKSAYLCLLLVRSGASASWKISGICLGYYNSSGVLSSSTDFWKFNSSSSVSGNARWIITYYLDIGAGIFLDSFCSWTSTEYDNNFLYYDTNYSPSVTQSTTVEFDTTQIDSLIFDGINFATTGQSQEVTYDNEDGVYSLSVVPVNGYKAKTASVTYLSDGDSDLPAVYDFVDNQVNINCPVGDAVTSITIESEVLSATVRCYFQTWQPNVEGNVTGAIDYGGSSGSLILPNFTFSFLDGAFLDYLELWDYAFSFVDSSSMLFNIRQYNLVGVSYYDGTPISFPLSVSNYDSSKGGIIFLTKRIMSSVSFSAPSSFAYVDSVEGAFPFPLGGYNYLTTYVYSVSPYALSSNLDWHIVVQNAYFPTSVGESDTEVHLYIDNQLIDYFVCPLSFNASLKFVAINMSPVSSYLSDLSNSNGVVYYLDNVIYVTSTSTNVTELYFSSNKSSWSPSFLDAFSYLGQVFDNVFEIMEINITRDMTLGTILLIVLSLGVLMFLFRMGGIF